MLHYFPFHFLLLVKDYCWLLDGLPTCSVTVGTVVVGVIIVVDKLVACTVENAALATDVLILLAEIIKSTLKLV